MKQETAILAASIVNILMPYFKVIANEVAKKVGSELPKNISKIWQRIKTRLSGDPNTEEILKDLSAHPDDQDLQAVFRVQLRKALEQDNEFYEQIKKLVQSEQARISNVSNQTGTGNISIQGSNNVVNQRIGQISKSITNIGYQPKQIPADAIPEFLDLMKSVPPMKGHITANLLNNETQFLAKQLARLLNQAGWEMSSDSLSMYSPHMPKGIVFMAPELTLSLDILAKFLKAVGFKNYSNFNKSIKSLTIAVNGVD